MRIQTTKTLLQVLKKEIAKDARFNGYSLGMCYIRPEYYTYYTGEDDSYFNADYDVIKNRYNTFIVEYPANYCAENRYITTAELTRIFRRSDKTFNGFIKAFGDAIEI